MTRPGDPGSTPEPDRPGGSTGQPGDQPPPAWNQPGDQPPAWGGPQAGPQWTPTGPPGGGPPPGWPPQPPTGSWQQPGPGPYGGGPMPASRPTNVLAIISLVSSLVWLCGIGSIVAVITGLLARGQIRQRNEGGAGLALAGLIIGGIGVVLTVLYFVVAVAAGTSNSFNY